MNNHQEDRSLVEVRVWKVAWYEEDHDLTYTEYCHKLKMLAEQIKSRYHITLQEIRLSPPRLAA